MNHLTLEQARALIAQLQHERDEALRQRHLAEDKLQQVVAKQRLAEPFFVNLGGRR